MTTWARGQQATFVSLNYDSDGQPVDLDSITVTVLDPLGQPVSGPENAVEVEPGRYEASWLVPSDAALGAWSVRWDATLGDDEATAVEAFTVVSEAPLPVEDPAASVCRAWLSPEDMGCDLTAASDVQVNRAIMAASETLWMLSGRRYGTCEVEVYPCTGGCAASGVPALGPGWRPVRHVGAWINVCGHHSACACGPVEAFELPPLPGIDVRAVTIEGEALPIEAWEVQRSSSGARLVRLDGGRWPVTNNLGVAAGEPGTWSLTLRYGEPVPYLGLQAAAILACEYLKAMIGDPTCALPKRVQTITRLGESMTFFDPQEYLADGRTGVDLADRFLAAVNPNKLSSAPTVWSPDVPSRLVRR